MSLECKNCQVGDILKIHYIQIQHDKSQQHKNRDEYFYAVVEEVKETGLFVSDIACTDVSEIQRGYDLFWYHIENNMTITSDFDCKFELIEIISFQDKLKEEFPECFI